MRHDNYIVFDVETTGLNTETDQIIEICFIEYKGGVETKCWNTLVRPDKRPSEKALQITKIAIDDLAGAPPLQQIAEEVAGWVRSTNESKPLVTFNGTRFDIPLLRAEFKRIGTELPAIKKHVDVMMLAKQKAPGLPSFSLLNVCKSLVSNSPKQTHRADDDCRMLSSVYEVLQSMENPIDNMDKELAAVSSPIVKEALEELSKHTDKIKAWTENASGLPCGSKEEFETTVDAIIELKRLKRQLSKLRTETLRPVKNISKSVESYFREMATKPIDNAIKQVEENQLPFLRELERQTEEKQQRELKEAEEFANSERDKQLNRGIPLEQANNNAEVIHSILESQIKKEKTKASTARGSASVETAWSCEIINEDHVPFHKHLWSPDIKKIEAAVTATDGGITIPGVVIKKVFKTKTYAKRR